jgi:hypothetical protein
LTHLATVFAVVLNCRAEAALEKPLIHHSANHHLSTFRRQRRILMRVHSVLRESLTFGDISLHGRGRMDNLLKVHS